MPETTTAMPETRELKMDTDFLIDTVKVHTRDVFSTMLMMDAEAGRIARVPSSTDGTTNADHAGLTDGVVGIIGIAGSWVGTGIIMCSPELACKASSAMMMTEYHGVNGEVLDAMGEITNMIIGNIKTALEDRYGSMGISVPTVVYGRNFATRTVSRGEWFIVGFKVGGEDLEIHVNLAPNPRAGEKVTPGFIRTEPVLA